MPFYATEDILEEDAVWAGQFHVKYAIGQLVSDEDAALNEDSVEEDPTPLAPVSSTQWEVTETATGLVVGDTVEGREKLRDDLTTP